MTFQQDNESIFFTSFPFKARETDLQNLIQATRTHKGIFGNLTYDIIAETMKKY